MIKINLLPRARVERRETGQLWLLMVLAAILLEGALLFIYHGMLNEQLRVQTRKNEELQAQIDKSRALVKNHGQVKDKLKSLRAREDAIAQLQSGRRGPTAVMLELARLMTSNRGPTVNADRIEKLKTTNPTLLHNQTWDARRLWLQSFVETGRRVRLEGLARDGEDVSELARRLDLSVYFYDIRLLPGERKKDQNSGLEFVSFRLEAKVRY